MIVALGSGAILLILWAAHPKPDSSEGARLLTSRGLESNRPVDSFAPGVADADFPSLQTTTDRVAQPGVFAELWTCFESSNSARA